MPAFPRMLAAAAAATFAVSPAFAVEETFETQSGISIDVETFADGLVHPWAIAFLPDGGILTTERPGRLRYVSANGEVFEPITGLPKVDARGQGGLLDVAVDPEFAKTRLVYFTFSEPGDGGNSTAAARGRLNDDMTALENVEVIFSQTPKVQSTKHFGSRLVFDGEGHLFVTMGERFERKFRGQAQELDSDLGKIVRINPDGSVPDDNPFVGKQGARHEIWAYGVRNVQAAAINPDTGRLWEIEHGPRGGDELNIIEPGKNYGWPEISLGINYTGTPVGSGKQHAEGMVDSILSWTPVIAPSGMMFYDGDAFADWRGDLFVGGLGSQALVRVAVDGNSAKEAERLLEDLNLRFRDVAQGPDGAIYVATDESNGEILRISPTDDTETGATE